MNIQKRRFSALLTMILIVCMMVTTFALPASASELDGMIKFYSINVDAAIFCAAFYETFGYDLQGFETYSDLAASIAPSGSVQCLVSSDLYYLLIYPNYGGTISKAYKDAFPDADTSSAKYHTVSLLKPDGSSLTSAYFCLVNKTNFHEFTEDSEVSFYADPSQGCFPAKPGSNKPSGSAFTWLTEEIMWHLMDEIKGILPVVVQALVGYIAIRKGIEFLQWCMNRA